MKVFIIGGVAGGASCAARLRRLSEENEITIIDRGPYVSFANCGLPYYVGDVIEDESKLLVATPALFKDRFNIDVRLENEVLKIEKKNKKIEIRDLKTKQICFNYDILRCLKQDYDNESRTKFDPSLECLLAMIHESSMTFAISYRLSW